MRTTLAPIAIMSIAAAGILSGCSLLGLHSVEDMQVAVGECISDSAVSQEEETEVGVLPVVDCDEPHDGEVYYVEDQTDASFPNDLVERANNICYDHYASFMGVDYEESTYWISTIVPSYDTWDAGDRQIACLVVGEEGELLTGSLKGSGA